MSAVERRGNTLMTSLYAAAFDWRAHTRACLTCAANMRAGIEIATATPACSRGCKLLDRVIAEASEGRKKPPRTENDAIVALEKRVLALEQEVRDRREDEQALAQGLLEVRKRILAILDEEEPGRDLIPRDEVASVLALMPDGQG